MTREKVREWLLPELDLIQDEGIRETIVSIWKEVIDENDWERKGLEHSGIATVMRDDCPENLMLHTRHVTAACSALYESLTALFDSCGSCNRQELLTGALLHDVGKLLEMDYVDGKVIHTHYGDLFTHPVSGAYLAKKYGLNRNIVHMILTHSNSLSPEGANAYNTPESLILKYVDEMCYKYVWLYWHM